MTDEYRIIRVYTVSGHTLGPYRVRNLGVTEKSYSWTGAPNEMYPLQLDWTTPLNDTAAIESWGDPGTELKGTTSVWERDI